MKNKTDSDTPQPNAVKAKARKPLHWMIYIAALLAGILLLADAANIEAGTRVTARLGIGLVYTAFAFIVGGARPSVYIGTTLLWLAIVLTFAL